MCPKKAVRTTVWDTLRVYEENRQEWARRTNPLHPVITYLSSRKSGKAAPAWVLEWLDAGFQRWLDSQVGSGKPPLSLESALALNGVGKRRVAWSAKRSQLLFMRFVDISHLRAIGNVKVSAATYLVCCREYPGLYNAADTESADTLQKKANTLAQQYSRFPGRAELTQFFEEFPPTRPTAAEFVSSFPRREVLRYSALKRLL